jgi:hypothetical protein
MQKALQGLSTQERELPSGITTAGGDYVYSEYTEGGGGGVNSIGITPPSPSDAKSPSEKHEEGQKSELF